MDLIRYPAPVDLTRFEGAGSGEALYGLPPEVVYCRDCVISNQRPNSSVEFLNTPGSKKVAINFDGEGVCDACRFAERKRGEIDWEAREAQLQELCDQNRKSDGSYDCIVPGSGGKDSFYASHILKTKYGMHPLTVTWAPHVYTEWGRRNFDRWIHAGHDNYKMNPNGRVHRVLTRLSTELLLHPFQAFIFGQKFLAPKMAELFNVPLVFYGEDEAEYGNPIGDTATATRSSDYFAFENLSQVHLGGVSIAELIDQFGLEMNDLVSYLPSTAEKVKAHKTEVHYLGYYLRWHPQSAYYHAVEHGGFEASPERTPGTFSKYNSIDDRIDDLHYYTTGAKFGIGRASYDAAQEIRSGDIDRDEGVALVRKYDHEYPERFIDEMMEYLSLPEKEFPVAAKMFERPIMDREYFDLLVDNFRTPHLWKWEGKWVLRHPIWSDS